MYGCNHTLKSFLVCFLAMPLRKECVTWPYVKQDSPRNWHLPISRILRENSVSSMGKRSRQCHGLTLLLNSVGNIRIYPLYEVIFFYILMGSVKILSKSCSKNSIFGYKQNDIIFFLPQTHTYRRPKSLTLTAGHEEIWATSIQSCMTCKRLWLPI